jgi:hypothetical protein
VRDRRLDDLGEVLRAGEDAYGQESDTVYSIDAARAEEGVLACTMG